MLQLKGITKQYYVGDMTVDALRGVDIAFRENEIVAILGQSGCGKTTLLNIIGGLDRYTTGDLIINGKSTKEYKDRDWDTYRNHSIGFIFQSYNLIPHQSVLANVELALTISGVSKEERRKRAVAALEKVGLGDQLNKKPNQMSGGQMQRVAIARALVNEPDILLADEPTGALDSQTSIQIMELLREISKDKLIIMVTHNPELAEQYANRIVKLKDGIVTDDSNPFDPDNLPAEEIEKINEEKLERENKKGKKTSMSFFTALTLSFTNLLTKKTRTILTAFAGSIGIIGIALILSVSQGFQYYVDSVERDTASSYPITIEGTTMDMTAMMASLMGETDDEEERDPNKIYSNDIMLSVMSSMSTGMTSNNLEAFKKHIDGNDIFKDNSVDIKYSYSTKLNTYTAKEDGGYFKGLSGVGELYSAMMPGSSGDAGTMGMMSTSPWTELVGNNNYISEQYDLIYGSLPQNYNDVVIIVGEDNTVSDFVLYCLGIRDVSELTKYIYESNMSLMDPTKPAPEKIKPTEYTFEEICDYDFRVLLQSDYYKLDGEKIVERTPDELNSVLDTAQKINISGIIKVKSGGSVGGIGYTTALMTKMIERANESDVVKAQLENTVKNLITDEEFTSGGHESALKKLGYVDFAKPDRVSFYPKDFESKDAITSAIDEYNNSVEENDKLTYTDTVALLMSSVTTIVDAVSYVLIAFVSISLVVSSIMIGIITYISVLERTKEIGILRSIGASKRDISRVFNAETLIVGFVAGLMGIIVSLLLLLPINVALHALTGIEELSAVLPLGASILLVVISMFLTFIAGLIPSKVASKKDPVIALRTE